MELPKKVPSPLQKGDKVILKSVRGVGWSRDGGMDGYCGTTMTILRMSSHIITFQEAPIWSFNISDIATVLPREDGTIPVVPESYSKRDLVVIVKYKPNSTRNCMWDNNMTQFLGTVQPIAEDFGDYCYLTDSIGQNWVFDYQWIERKATPEDLLIYEEQLRKESEEREKKLAHLCISPKKVGDIAIEIFGEDEVMINSIDSKKFEVIVHFPEIDILNSGRKTTNPHKIRDIFARFTVYNINPTVASRKCSISFSGSRTTWTVKEQMAQYSHSHMSGSNFPTTSGGWSEFCVGYSEYKVLLDNCSVNAESDNWYLLFYGLKNYLSWESLEGGPYRRIDNFNNSGMSGSRSLNGSELQMEADRLLPSIPRELWEYTPDGFTMNNNSPKVINFFEDRSQYKQMIISGQDTRSYMARNGSAKYKFNKREFPYTVIDESSKTVNTKEIKIEPAIVAWYCNYLTTKIRNFNKTYSYELLKQNNASVFTRHRVEKHPKVDHKPELAEADQPIT